MFANISGRGVDVWDVKTGQIRFVAQSRAFRIPINVFAFNANGTHLITGSYESSSHSDNPYKDTSYDFIKITRYFALVVGIAFILAGTAGFLPFLTPPAPQDAPHLSMDANYGFLLGMFPVNRLHSLFHLSVAIFGLYAFRTYSTALLFSRFIGITLGIFTIMGLIPQLNTTFGLFPLFGHDIWLHGLESAIGIYLGFFAVQSIQIPDGKAA